MANTVKRFIKYHYVLPSEELCQLNAVKDTQRNIIAKIIFKDQLLYCNSPDSSSDCEHTRFATSLIDVAKYLQEK